MQGRTTIQLGVIAVILGCSLYLLDEYLAQRQTVRVQIQRVFDVTTDPVSVVRFENGGDRVEFVRKGESWFLQTPVRARANEQLVERMVSVLEKLRWEEYITREDREESGLSFSDYGLEPSAQRISMETAGGRVEVLRIGAPAPFGGKVYGQIEKTDGVFTLQENVLTLFPKTLSDWRDRTLVYGSPEKTERIDIYRRDAGFIQLVHQKGEWLLQQPLTAKADTPAVRKLIESALALRVTGFIWDAKPGAAPGDEADATQEMELRGQIETAGLAADAARLKVTLYTEGDRLGQEILIGRNTDSADSVFARKSGVDAVYAVPSAVVESIGSVTVDALRDRAVFYDMAAANIGFVRLTQGENRIELQRLPNGSGWQMLTPVKVPADAEAVNALIVRLLGLKAVNYLSGDHPSGNPPDDWEKDPVMSIGLAVLPDAAAVNAGVTSTSTPRTVELLLGGETAGGRQRLARNSLRDENFTLSAEALDGFDATLVTPLHFRNRLMLAVNTGTVCRVQIVTPDGGTQHVDRVDTPAPARWICEKDNTPHQVNASIVADVLAAAERIEAGRLIDFMPLNLSLYGLDLPTGSVTFGFSGESGIQNTLLMGRLADDAWRYAMVQGHDFVFLLSAATARRLLQSICVAPPLPLADTKVSADAPLPVAVDGQAVAGTPPPDPDTATGEGEFDN